MPSGTIGRGEERPWFEGTEARSRVLIQTEEERKRERF